jgi:curved DNA-binding protein CbpA
MLDYYEILEVSPNASQDVISAAYKILIQRHGPDNNSNTPETIQKISDYRLAYDVLSDPEKRNAYDLEWCNTRKSNTKLSRSDIFDEAIKESITGTRRSNTVQVAGTMTSKASDSNYSYGKPRLYWKRVWWALSILAVVLLLFSMVRPDPEKLRRGQLAVSREAERESKELEAKLRKNAPEEQKVDTPGTQ